MISHLVGQPINAAEHDDHDDYSDVSDEDADESQYASPTPAAAKHTGPLQRGKKAFLEVGRKWSVLESGEAHQEVLRGLSGLEERVSKKLGTVNIKAASRNDYVLEEVRDVAAIGEETQGLTKETAKAVESLTTTAAVRLSVLDGKVGELSSPPPPDALERKIEELSG